MIGKDVCFLDRRRPFFKEERRFLMWDDYTQRTDNGFEWYYFNLSYRRKMIRTLWMTPLMPVLYFLLRFIGLDLMYTLIVMAICLVAHILQIAYNYHMWNKYERSIS